METRQGRFLDDRINSLCLAAKKTFWVELFNDLWVTISTTLPAPPAPIAGFTLHIFYPGEAAAVRALLTERKLLSLSAKLGGVFATNRRSGLTPNPKCVAIGMNPGEGRLKWELPPESAKENAIVSSLRWWIRSGQQGVPPKFEAPRHTCLIRSVH